uniref:hypothetical protein n=1 Tax=Streptomyces sp. C10-9-1 TaxID=1859285 RepID=UPI003D706816
MHGIRRRSPAAVALAVLAALLLGGCADGGGRTAADPPPTDAGSPTGAAPEQDGAPPGTDPGELARMQRLVDAAESAADAADAD